MPELPEVQTVVDTLRPDMVGRKIVAVNLLRLDMLEPQGVDLPARLMGRTIRAIERRGKRIIFTLDDTHRFFIHLGMSGRLTIHSPADAHASHTHLILDVAATDRFAEDRPSEKKNARKSGPKKASKTQLRFRDPRRFGGIWWMGKDECDSGMGPEPLEVQSRQLADRLGRTTRAIKNALLDQRLIAGLGNIYVDESLFEAGIHPLKPANKLSNDEVKKLTTAIKATLRRAIRHRGSTLRDYRDAQGKAGGFQSLHRVYGRARKPCPICQTPIERIVLGGRSTHFCPKCQSR